jgi:hypothetical protein
MIKSIKLRFDKLRHDTGRAILVSVRGRDHWIPKKLCRKLSTNNKLEGSVCVPSFIVEGMGINLQDCEPDIEVIHHIPEAKDKSNIKHDADLFT